MVHRMGHDVLCLATEACAGCGAVALVADMAGCHSDIISKMAAHCSASAHMCAALAFATAAASWAVPHHGMAASLVARSVSTVPTCCASPAPLLPTHLHRC